ncbi:protein-L-isoaspartate(D-aspartate) O-methyltransferase [Thioalkalivibrio paradoxus]|uniref:Protein-L-isoaspartate O-methyltransferase n=1 Tax=Thioalkalivibrio paradoxus ARh 1 TaxID=713585 RepID=W0DP79_9GAMM|nr:protein-L-isoaspartate(D-aspartate) O-methyltransferase [Thioalkalivibrio paradoxus]AHE99062.1 protein-L-isoaspartate O-methyltransferase [Thioalkalivibrio paradoxus ARh 1]
MTSVIRVLIWGLLAGSLTGPVLAQDGRFDRERERMVATQVEARGIQDPATLEALRRVPRHRFVPEDRRRHAYQDRPVPIGYGQTISQPFLVAYMTELLKPRPGMRVLEIGTGSGYQAAVLAEILDEVFTVEIIGELAQWGETNLRRAGYGHVRVKQADGYYGWEEHAPFDAIVVTAAADHIPPPLLDQLRDGGRMVIPVGSPFRTQTLMLITRDGDRTVSESLLPVRFVPLTRKTP